MHGPLNQIAGGWRVSTIFQWHGGVPFTPVIQGNLADAINGGMASSIDHGGATLYPNQVGDPGASQHSVVSQGSSTHSGIGGWFNPAAFANPATGTFGDTRRNTLIGPGYTNVDLSLGKEFPITERTKLEIRADAYNAFNHVNYANPDANVGYSGGVLADSTAGTITGPAGFNSNMRIIQLGARFSF